MIERLIHHKIGKWFPIAMSVLSFAFCHLLVNGFSNLGQKIQVKDKMTADEQNYYLGMYNTLPALFFCIIEMHFGFGSILYIL